MAFGYIVYGLRRPDGQFTYVGQTERTLIERLGGHVAASRKGDSEAHEWMQVLLGEGREPSIDCIVELCRGTYPEQLDDLERIWTKKLLDEGHPLTNVHNGARHQRRRRHRKRPKYSTGERIGRLTVLEFFDALEARRHEYRCRCDCGNEVTVTSTYFGRAKHPSCGCWGREIAQEIGKRNGQRYGGGPPSFSPGDKIGPWTVVREHDRQGGKRRYVVVCEHGREQIRRLNKERARPRKSCGCPSVLR